MTTKIAMSKEQAMARLNALKSPTFIELYKATLVGLISSGIPEGMANPDDVAKAALGYAIQAAVCHSEAIDSYEKFLKKGPETPYEQMAKKD